MSEKTVQLYGVGVGPGDPELITVKGMKAIQSADVIAYHETKKRNSNALKIAKQWIPDNAELAPITYPITTEKDSFSDGYNNILNDFYNQTAEYISSFLKVGKRVVVLAEGDPLFFSSFMYIYDKLGKDYATEIIPGISSIFASAAIFQTPICYRNQTLTVLSGVSSESELTRKLADGDAFAIMKLGRNLGKVRKILKNLGMVERALYIERATMENQKIVSLPEVDEDSSPYFSLILIPGIPQRTLD